MGLALKRRDLRTDTLPSGYTFTRTQTGTIASYFNLAGVMSFAAPDVARFDYNPSTLARKGLLIEGERTNLCLRSREFDNATWTKATVGGLTAAAVTANQIAGLDGTTVAEAIAFAGPSTTGQYGAVAQSIGAATNGQSYIGSTYYRAQSGTANTYISVEGGGNATQSCSLTTAWTRYSVSRLANSGSGRFLLLGPDTRVANSAQPAPQSAASVYADCAQLEAGSFPTSYIPTSGSAVTRGADTVSISTPPVDTTQSFAVVLNYALLPGASAGGYAIHESAADAFVPTSANGRSVLRFNADTLGWDYHNFGESLQTSTLGDPPGDLTIGSLLGIANFANATFSGIDWYQGLATDDQMQALSDGAVISGGLNHALTRPIVRPLSRSLVRPLST